MLEDRDVRVRRAAWHTLEDGGRPDDSALDAIIERVAATETDAFVKRMIAQAIAAALGGAEDGAGVGGASGQGGGDFGA